MTKLRWRRTWFQVHKWLGLLLAVLIIPLCLSGALLVYGEALDHALNPQRYTVSGTQRIDPDRYAAAAMVRAKPGDRVAQLTWPAGDGAVQVALASAAAGSARGGTPIRTVVYLDPPTARVLDVAASNGGLLRFIHVLHGSLQIPGGWGRTIVGWIGVAMMISAFTGLWLWWPTIGSVRRGLRWRRHPNLDTNLHQTFGFWIALPLFVLSLTGAWIAFPAFFGALTGSAPRGPDRSMQARATPAAATRLTAGQAAARASALLPGPVRSITWPTERKPDWSVAIGQGRGRAVSVADDGGVAALAPDPGVAGGQNRLVRSIHEGSIGGPLWRLIVFVAGLIPAMLGVTGVIMWWRARGWKAALAARRRARAAA